MACPFIPLISNSQIEAASASHPSGNHGLLQGGTDHIGETARVRGLVEEVSFSKKGNAFLNF